MSRFRSWLASPLIFSSHRLANTGLNHVVRVSNHIQSKKRGQDARRRREERPEKPSQSQSDQEAPDKSSSEADMFFELMEESCKTGRTGWDEGLIGQVSEI